MTQGPKCVYSELARPCAMVTSFRSGRSVGNEDLRVLSDTVDTQSHWLYGSKSISLYCEDVLHMQGHGISAGEASLQTGARRDTPHKNLLREPNSIGVHSTSQVGELRGAVGSSTRRALQVADDDARLYLGFA